MSREIRFRAWHKTQKVMSSDGEYHYFDFIDRDHGSRVSSSYDLQEAIASDCIEVMQYTGLTDKNGTPIYEGDIVQYINMVRGPARSKIEWSPFDAMAGFQCRSPFVNIFDQEEVEVIGNIYENPDLLESN